MAISTASCSMTRPSAPIPPISWAFLGNMCDMPQPAAARATPGHAYNPSNPDHAGPVIPLVHDKETLYASWQERLASRVNVSFSVSRDEALRDIAPSGLTTRPATPRPDPFGAYSRVSEVSTTLITFRFSIRMRRDGGSTPASGEDSHRPGADHTQTARRPDSRTAARPGDRNLTWGDSV